MVMSPAAQRLALARADKAPANAGLQLNAARAAKTAGALSSNLYRPLSHMPAGAALTPSGDIGVRRQRESVAVGGFKDGATVVVSSIFRGGA